MGFNAGEAVDSLDYDFSDYVEGARGTIPEPHQEQVDALFDALRETMVAAGAEVGATPEAIISGLSALDPEVIAEQNDNLLNALDKFCQGTPSRAEIEALPIRPRQAFIGWLTGQLLDPGKADMSRPLVQANGAGPLT